MSQFFRYVGERGELELLPEGTVERELAERGERLYQLADLDDLLAELRDTREGHSSSGLAESPANPEDLEAPEMDTLDVEEVGALLLEVAVANHRDSR